MSSITVRHDLRDRFGQSRDQGGRPTCLSFAASDAHAAARGQPWLALSCEYLYYRAKQRDGLKPTAGTTTAAIQTVLEDDGQPAEIEWPYLSSLPSNIDEWLPPTVGMLYKRQFHTISPGFNQIWDKIEADIPILMSMTISDAFYRPDQHGVVDVQESEQPFLRHAVVAVATGERAKSRLILIRNSWGNTWGLHGYAWLSELYLSPRIQNVLTPY